MAAVEAYGNIAANFNVLPLIFAYSFMAFPSTLIQLTGGTTTGFGQWWSRYMYSTSPWYLLTTALLTEVEKLIDFVTADHLDQLG